MSALTRKQLLLSPENVSRLQAWADRYDLSEAELVRRAIQAYDPEDEQAQSASDEREREAAALLDQMESALKQALAAVDAAHACVQETLADRDNPARRAAIIEDVRKEVAENPGWLDEVAELLADPNEDAA